jgi:hypothetical protein
MSDNVLVPIQFVEQLPSTQIGSDLDFDSIAKSSDFLPRLQLYTKGKAINRKLVQPGNYGIPVSDDEVTDLGDTIDVLPLARRPKAIDLKDTQNVVAVYDLNDAEFERIKVQSAAKESGCMYGPSFLVYERSTGQFLEFFCGTKSARTEAKRIYPCLPLTQAMIDALEATGVDTSGMEPRGSHPVTLKSKLVEKGQWSWHVPVAIKCSTPFTKLPPAAVIVEQINKFLDVKREGAAVSAEAPNKPQNPDARVR